METYMPSNNLDSIIDDCFESSTLNHISQTPSPKPSPKPYPEHTLSPDHNRVQLSKPVIDSPNLMPIIQILENTMNPIDIEHPAGEANDD